MNKTEITVTDVSIRVENGELKMTYTPVKRDDSLDNSSIIKEYENLVDSGLKRVRDIFAPTTNVMVASIMIKVGDKLTVGLSIDGAIPFEHSVTVKGISDASIALDGLNLKDSEYIKIVTDLKNKYFLSEENEEDVEVTSDDILSKANDIITDGVSKIRGMVTGPILDIIIAKVIKRKLHICVEHPDDVGIYEADLTGLCGLIDEIEDMELSNIQEIINSFVKGNVSNLLPTVKVYSGMSVKDVMNLSLCGIAVVENEHFGEVAVAFKDLCDDKIIVNINEVKGCSVLNSLNYKALKFITKTLNSYAYRNIKNVEFRADTMVIDFNDNRTDIITIPNFHS